MIRNNSFFAITSVKQSLYYLAIPKVFINWKYTKLCHKSILYIYKVYVIFGVQILNNIVKNLHT